MDSVTLSEPEHPILVLNLYGLVGRTFRVIRSEMWGVENNVSIANLGNGLSTQLRSSQLTDTTLEQLIPPPPGLPRQRELRDRAREWKTLQTIKRKIIDITMTNRTKRKYEGLPPTAPVPEVDSIFDLKRRWDLWEWWAGKGGITVRMSRRNHTVGPPITWDTGWDIRNDRHRQDLRRLQYAHKPRILVAEPTCGPWSNSNTNMSREDLELIRNQELKSLTFLYESFAIQANEFKADYVLEQPRASEMLSLQPIIAIQDLDNCLPDQYGCHCRHGLADPENSKPMMKPFVLRGSVPFPRTCVWCNCPPDAHQHVQGTLRSGQLRTEFAQTFTTRFCNSFVRDLECHLKMDVNFTDTPESRVPGIRRREFVNVKLEPQMDDKQMTSTEALPADKDDAKESKSDDSSSSSSSSSSEEEAAKPSTAEPSAVPSPPEPPEPHSDARPPKAPKPKPKAKAKAKPSSEDTINEEFDIETSKATDEIFGKLATLMPKGGGTRTMRQGHKSLAELQALHSSHRWLFAIAANKPKTIPAPEPTWEITHRMVMAKMTDDEDRRWFSPGPQSEWPPEDSMEFPTPPLKLFVLYGVSRDSEPLESLIPASEAAEINLRLAKEEANIDSDLTLREMEQELILRKLKGTRGNRTVAAQELGISVRTLRNKLNLYTDQGVSIPG